MIIYLCMLCAKNVLLSFIEEKKKYNLEKHETNSFYGELFF